MKKTVNDHTKLYLYDLQNAATEHGFKADDTWELMLASEKEKALLQRDYYPMIALKIFPDLLRDVLQATKAALKQPLSQEDELLNNGTIAQRELTYIVAFNFKRPRT
ncbi:hypothetical protein FPZ43_00925 [Mucilaginibacter pallidiroseus]|uniref:Uncharacterized protein n=1 Tax=Mucilaginibacter pallidiroseus TaxID=2599295 RepID=A0A563UI79_9SPHI|nr:hypothetical protein [Mucilaginibacter pallidiroseus]TWR31077.1 hypothetical protein FPZ43_00925 [Mucilaginibacter pallidiroseus]